MLEKPRSQDVCGHFGENPSLLVVPPLSVGLVFLAGARGGHGPVQAVACRDAKKDGLFSCVQISNPNC